MKSRFVVSQLRHRPGRALALGAAILAASATFVVLAAAAKTSGLEVRGTVKSHFRAAYDVLVRPKGSATPFERRERLVRDNYLSGVFGGISLEQFERIKALAGVEVAAPIANIGYVLLSGAVPVSIQRFVGRDPVQLYRIRLEWLAHGGASSYPGGDAYVYYNRVHRFTADRRGRFPGAPQEIVPGRGAEDVCGGLTASTPEAADPFARSPSLHCFSSRTPQVNRNNFLDAGDVALRGIGVIASGTFPILLAAIDPVQEERLLHLEGSTRSGRYLRSSDRATTDRAGHPIVPVLASERPYVQETLRARVERLRVRRPRDVPQLLVAGQCKTPFVPCPAGELEPPPRGWPRATTAYSFLTSARGRIIGRTTVPIALGYRSMLAGRTFRDLSTPNYWTVSQPTYRRRADGTLEPRSTTNSTEVFAKIFGVNAPPENRDLQFRRLRGHAATGRFLPTETATAPTFRIVGRYDPAELPGFSRLSKVPLETYYPPLLRPVGAASRRALHGRPLAPTQNLGDYIQQPPLMLTTIRALPAFYGGAHGTIAAKAPISAIRIRVAGVTGPDDRSRARIESVALRIHAQTGLDVDITAGSSPHPLTIRLPRGKFGRPALTLSEGWIQKGVSASFLNGVGRKQLALFALIPLICCLFLANGAYAAGRTRRAEIGTLLSLGWSRGALFAIVLGEIVLIGAVAGALGIGIAAGLVRALSLETPLAATALVLPVALAIALLAGLAPAWSAARAAPLAAFRPPVTKVKNVRRVSRLTGVALLNLRRARMRALVAGSGLMLGACALTVLLAVQHSFHGVLSGTLLGDAIAFQIGGFDYLAVALVIALAAISVADVVYLNLRERQAELVTLRTLGWSELHLVRLICVEALALAVTSTVVGATFGLAISAAFLDVPPSSLVVGGLAAAGGGVVAALLASLLPLSQIERLTPPLVLAADE